jgi:hypothetical protein
MMTFTDLTGQRFGLWTVLAYAGNHPTKWLCRCDCGSERVVRAGNLKSGISNSCGCDFRRRAAVRARTHGMSRTLIYGIWTQMKKRCHNPKDKSYPEYGGRGIHVCERWRNSFPAFLEDMGPRPSPAHSLDRIDGTKGYEPGNVRWATSSQQYRNVERNAWVVVNGRRMVLKDACVVLGLPYDAVRRRIGRGWTVKRALSTPIMSSRYAKVGTLQAEVYIP